MNKISLTALAALSLLAAGCVAVPVGPQGGGTGSVTAPTGALASAVGGGRAYVNTQTGQTLNLWSDGSYTMSSGNQQSFGTWSTVESSVAMCFTGPVAAYAGGACVPVRFDGDFLELYDTLGEFVQESWAVN
ncbi:hypothetical protein [Hasllibacter sp. MH4015]|uniref:hypothetical protein n=1 Tax=Hasllibacter sp. MH4015 TaxID=2854029 RepID=UPI001CD6EBE1|nr:hypothetical protein [Hasllibacter sp. MH4015]